MNSALEDFKNAKILEITGTHPAYVFRIYDLDTITVTMMAFGELHKFSIRVMGVDSPEIRSKIPLEKKLAYEGRDWARALLLNKHIRIICHGSKDDKYGRTLGQVFYGEDGTLDYAEQALKMKLCLPYEGKTKTDADSWVRLREERDELLAE